MQNILFAFSLLAVSSLTSALPQCPPLGSVNFLLPHETDCSKFYICAHGTPLLQTCPDGTHFNPNFMVCQNPVFAGCDTSPPDSELPCTWPDFNVHHPHPESCAKYYVCEFGTAVVFNCPEGLEFNAQLQQCTWPQDSDCGVLQSDALQDGGTQNGGSQDGGSQYGGSQDGCRSGALSRHEDCGKYYLCAHGANVAMDCPSGLQWSSKLEQCAWPQDSDCGVLQSDASQDGGLQVSQDDGLQDGSLQVSQNDGSQDGGLQVSQDVESQDGGSQDGCRSGALSRHEDCGKYYLCAHGANVAMDCPSGLQWSSKSEQCVWPHDSDCDTQDGAQSVSQDGGQDGCQNNALSAHDCCSKYYICSHGVNVAMDCPAGLHWNSRLSICDWPVAAGCEK